MHSTRLFMVFNTRSLFLRRCITLMQFQCASLDTVCTLLDWCALIAEECVCIQVSPVVVTPSCWDRRGNARFQWRSNGALALGDLFLYIYHAIAPPTPHISCGLFLSLSLTNHYIAVGLRHSIYTPGFLGIYLPVDRFGPNVLSARRITPFNQP